jgi:hypothetical protein
VTAAQMNAHVRDNLSFLHDVAYNSNTPSLTASSSNPTLGSGSVANGRYIQINKLVYYFGRVIFGSSGVAAGSGDYRVSLPINWGAPIGSDVCGVAWLVHAGNYAQPLCRFDGSAVGYFIMPLVGTWPATGGSNVGAAVPWTWAANDEIHWAITYEGV